MALQTNSLKYFEDKDIPMYIGYHDRYGCWTIDEATNMEETYIYHYGDKIYDDVDELMDDIIDQAFPDMERRISEQEARKILASLYKTKAILIYNPHIHG